MALLQFELIECAIIGRYDVACGAAGQIILIDSLIMIQLSKTDTSSTYYDGHHREEMMCALSML